MEKATLVALILYYLLLYETFGTVDINLAEFNYLANHLLPEECRKLAAALHFSHYENKNAVDEAGRSYKKKTKLYKTFIYLLLLKICCH